ncbi:MAG: hypothetical protein IKF79_02270 [Methanosphaera sp.]|nr:hypothetical protein [Methanosphaera sp.]
MGKGTGDLYIQSFSEDRIISSEIFTITDIYYYDSQTVDKNRYTVTVGTATLDYNSDGFKSVGTVTVDTFVENTALTLPTNYELEYTVTERFTDSANHYGGYCVDDLLISISTTYFTFYRLSTLTNLGGFSYSLQDGDVLKVVMENNTVKLYINDVLKKTQSNISNTGVFQARIYNNRGVRVKDLKVKEL